MLKLFQLVCILIFSNPVVCPSIAYTGTVSPIPNTATPIVNTLILGPPGTSGPFPTSGATFTWSRNTNLYTFQCTVIVPTDHQGGRAVAMGLGDASATTTGANGFIGGISLGVASGHSPSYIFGAQTNGAVVNTLLIPPGSNDFVIGGLS
jgi:hypothetical protein